MKTEEARQELQTDTTNADEMRRSFEVLRSRLGEDVRGVWEVYMDEDHTSLIYLPIAFMKFEEVLAMREKLADQEKLVLLGVEVALEEICDRDLDNPRRSGCFRATEWLTPELKPATKPVVLKNIKRSLGRQSGWLTGGPR